MSLIRRRGCAIVDTPNGILVVAGRNKRFMLPGGGAQKGESRKKATIRELYEEAGLKTKDIHYLFRSVGHKWHTKSGKSVRNDSKVFLVKAYGHARPRNEIKYLAFWKPDSKLKIGSGARKVIIRYLSKYKK